MARKPRFEFPGAIHHVFSRGNYRKVLFSEKGSGQAFEKALFEALESNNWLLHAYTIMSNHYHLLLETPEGNLSSGMQWLLGTFANRFNRFRNESGHVFQGRFKSKLVEPGESLRRVADYIHLNPVRAGIVSVKSLSNYAFSSYARFWRAKPRPRLIRKCFLAELGLPDSLQGMQAYEQWLNARNDKNLNKLTELLDQFQGTWIIGSLEYKEKIVSQFSGMKLAKDWAGEELQDLVQGKCENIIRKELVRRGITEEEICASPKLAQWKIEISRLLRRQTSVSNPWIALRLNMGHPSNVSRYLKKMPKSKG